MDTFTGYERQRSQVVNNTLSFIQGKSCNNCLLYGDKGTGKSSTVKAIANEFRKDGLRIVEMPKDRLIDFPLLVDKIAALPLKFIIFIDDLSFQHQDQSYTTLKAVLEGGLAARPDNALIYATSNRRHLVKESISTERILLMISMFVTICRKVFRFRTVSVLQSATQFLQRMIFLKLYILLQSRGASR